MSEVKVHVDASDIVALATLFSDEGISEKKQQGSGDANFLPEEGKFTGFTFAGEGSMRHCVVLTEPAGHCSLSNLQSQAVFDTKKEEVKFEPSQREDIKGSLFPAGSSKLNPQIPSGQLLALQMIVGKRFKAKPVEGIVQDYKADAKGNPVWEKDLEKAKARLIAKKFYKIELRPEAK